ncbi:hypothetical protein [Pseudonocardia asaccharolytica]|uniref:Uncharacterized protein n=1 Tax=Pseudonocardia asaccharolytica DSM 44247 = NBRC 16224 TaxID=1123024 RepID=A0A511D3V9_9PSEU|nr:hypothetical protein PA7_32970 [Pseudonocardia asaccharolytica DSM 44247 = NBRC 16224]
MRGPRPRTARPAALAARCAVPVELTVELTSRPSPTVEAIGYFVVADDPPDIVVADVRMPPTHSDEGLRAALVIRSRWPHSPRVSGRS